MRYHRESSSCPFPIHGPDAENRFMWYGFHVPPLWIIAGSSQQRPRGPSHGVSARAIVTDDGLRSHPDGWRLWMSARALLIAGTVAAVASGGLVGSAHAQDHDGSAGSGLHSQSRYHESTPSRARGADQRVASNPGEGEDGSPASREVAPRASSSHRGRQRIGLRPHRGHEHDRGRRGSGGLTCYVWSYGGYGSRGFDTGYCYTFEPGFGTQRQPLPLLW